MGVWTWVHQNIIRLQSRCSNHYALVENAFNPQMKKLLCLLQFTTSPVFVRKKQIFSAKSLKFWKIAVSTPNHKFTVLLLTLIEHNTLFISSRNSLWYSYKQLQQFSHGIKLAKI